MPQQTEQVRLFDYGIFQERSDYRVHVCPKARRIYVFETRRAVEAIRTGRYPKRKAYQAGVEGETAEGYLVPPEEIAGCVAIVMSAREAERFSEGDSTSEKGRKARDLVYRLLKYGGLPIPRLARPVEDRMLDLMGADIIVLKRAALQEEKDLVIQVKCDYPGGDRESGGTGNLFLQTSERNPLGLH